jgi:hypothetical protein
VSPPSRDADLQKPGASLLSSAQLRAISSMMSSHGLLALHGGWVAGETSKHWRTYSAARSGPTATAQLSTAFARSANANSMTQKISFFNLASLGNPAA